MPEQTSAPKPGNTAAPGRSSPGTWWRQTGNPAFLAGLIALAGIMALLLALGILSRAQASRALLVGIWLAIVLLLIRLPHWLRQERRRTVVISLPGTRRRNARRSASRRGTGGGQPNGGMHPVLPTSTRGT